MVYSRASSARGPMRGANLSSYHSRPFSLTCELGHMRRMSAWGPTQGDQIVDVAHTQGDQIVAVAQLSKPHRFVHMCIRALKPSLSLTQGCSEILWSNTADGARAARSTPLSDEGCKRMSEDAAAK